MGVTSTTAVNLRSKASASSSILGVIGKDKDMTVLDCAGGANWWHVTYAGLDGYVSSTYTYETGAMDVVTLPAPVCLEQLVWTTTAVNLRSAASASSKIKIVVPKGTQLTVMDCDGGPNWQHVAYNGMRGYVSAAYTAKDLG